jgi:uncharacterized protein (TIGR00730 family)
MKTPAKSLPKAYENITFLNGPQARTIRILSEFLEPRDRFWKEGIRDTIVVFGSARIQSGRDARKKLEAVKSALKKKKRITAADKDKIEAAQTELEMSRFYEDAARLTAMLTKWSSTLSLQRNFVICSGGGPGIMEAANKGAIEAGGKSIGLNISLPFEQESNPYISENLGFEFHYFFMRKFWFVYLAKAVIMFPGGFGTIDEMMEVLTLLQTRKVTKPLPVVLYGREYWQEVLNFKALLKYRVISREDLALFQFADSPEEAFRHLKRHLTNEFKKQKKILNLPIR